MRSIVDLTLGWVFLPVLVANMLHPFYLHTPDLIPASSVSSKKRKRHGKPRRKTKVRLHLARKQNRRKR